MKKMLRVTVALLLAVIMAAGIAVQAAAEVKTSVNVPVVYVKGYGYEVYNAEGEQIFDFDAPDGYISEAVSDCLPLLLKAIATGDNTEYSERLVSWVIPLFDELRLDKNGENTSGSYVDNNFTQNVQNVRANGCYTIIDYVFNYDWRLDPFENAAILNNILRMSRLQRIPSRLI